MELQLGLAQPIGTSITRGFDLNFCVYEPKEDVGCTTLNQFGSLMSSTTETNSDKYNKRKRSFGEAFELKKASLPTTLPLLLLWNNQPNDDEDDDQKDDDDETDSSSTINKNDNNGDGAVVGWPPLKNLRKRLCNFNPCDRSGNNRTTTTMMMMKNNNTSKYVKVKMEGDGIARKIDLSRYFSYQTLLDTLIAMFDKFEENVKEYNLTYQDSEGDWLLAGDVPWRTFIGSAQRLRLLKSGCN